LLAVVGCGEGPSGGFTDTVRPTPVVVAVNYPLGFFASEIAGDQVEVRMPFDKEGDPAFWKPSTRDLVEVAEADLILLNGAEYAKWARDAVFPKRKAVVTAEAFKGQWIRSEGTVVHSHGPGGEHSHDGWAVTTWLDLDLAERQAGAVLEGLQSFEHLDTVAMQQKFEGLSNRLRELDAQLKGIGEELQGKTLLASHPVYPYLARRYGLAVRSFHWEPGIEIREVQWARLETAMKETGASILLWEEEPIGANRMKLDQLGITQVVFDPCDNVPPDGDFISVMQANVERLAHAVGRLKGTP